MAASEPIVKEIFIEATPEEIFPYLIRSEKYVLWMGLAAEIDARPGGAYRYCLHSSEGTDHRVRGVFKEIVEQERLVYTWAWVDADGRPGHETLVTVTFADHGAKTLLTLRQALFESVTARDEHRGGWSSALDCLAEYLAAV